MLKVPFILALVVLAGCATTSIVSDSDEPSTDALIAQARAGDGDAIEDLCYRYKYGDQAKLDYARALEWCSKAAGLGRDNSQTLLAEMYLSGQGTAVDYERARYWYEAAAAQGHRHALFKLFSIYNEGIGVPADPVTAMKYLNQSADAGYEKAIVARKALLQRAGNPVQP